MSSFEFSKRLFVPTPPEKGSFPLDHEGQCKKTMIEYMICLKSNRNNNSDCRLEAKNYLQCRMDNNLMTREDWSKLGLSDVEDTNKKE